MEKEIIVEISQLIKDLNYLKKRTIRAEILVSFDKDSFENSLENILIISGLLILFGYNLPEVLTISTFVFGLLFVFKLIICLYKGIKTTINFNYWVKKCDKQINVDSFPALEFYSLLKQMNSMKVTLGKGEI